MFVGRSLMGHMLRGIVGFAALVGGLIVGQWSVFGFLLIPIGLVALRGCPACWLIGLGETLRNRVDRNADEQGDECVTCTVRTTSQVERQNWTNT